MRTKVKGNALDSSFLLRNKTFFKQEIRISSKKKKPKKTVAMAPNKKRGISLKKR
jgi:hypothetical protein